MTTRQYVSTNSRRAMAGAVLVLASAVSAGAQTTQVAAVDGRWTPWVGCWQPSARDAAAQDLAPNKAVATVCIAPAPGNATIDLITVTGATVEAPERIDAAGTRRAVTREGCTGWESAEFSPDGARIYLTSEHQCTGNRTRTSTGIMSISPNGEWLDVQGVKVDSHSGVRVVHYGRVPAPPVLSAEVRAALDVGSMARSVAVIAASDSVQIADVVEATKRVDPLVVQTWLVQRGQGFGVDAKRLAALADANVPSNIIDVMVALSYPRAFAINLAQADGQVVPTGNQAQANAEEGFRDGPVVYMNWDPMYSSSYGYQQYGYGYRGGLLGYPGQYPYWYYQGGPVVITRPSDNVVIPPSDTRGRMVRGSGYTRPPDRTDGGSSGAPRSSTSDGSSSGGSKSTGSSSGSTGSSEPRTAKPRSP